VKVLDEVTGSEFKKKVAVLKTGDSFGDLSLLYGAPRNATIKTKEDTDLIVMTKDAYEKAIKSQ
jgi:CRP-like cAMP-binding protein